MKRIHFMGIGGVGMAGLAFLLHRAGHIVTGCDKYASDRTRWLEANGMPVALGHGPGHLAQVDELIVTPAVPSTAPELQAARAAGIPVRYRGAVLAELVNAADGIAVCGTHGKTTTSTFATKLLRALGDAPAWCIGGETGTMPVAGAGTDPLASAGTDPLVVEADESDGTLALYHPRVLVLNAVDFDHLEHFASPEAYFDCYRAAVRNTTDTVVVCADHPRALALARDARTDGTRLVTFGFAPSADVPSAAWPQLGSLVLGRHNVLNALAAIAVAQARGHSVDAIAAALPDALAELPDRRFQTVARIPGATPRDEVRVVTDYAHHPAELRCAVDMARACAPRRLRVLFQPHRYSRTRALLDEFPPAFAAADDVVLIPVYAAFEAPLPGGDIADLYRAFRAARPATQAPLLARSAEEAWRHVFLTAEPGDLILLAGAGDIVNLLPRVRQDLATCPMPFASTRSWCPLAPLSFFRTGGATCGGGRRVIVGMGSNTWFSDCADDAEIVQPMLPPGASILSSHPELAFMAGIPGSLGGWIKMNAGAFGHSISERIRRVKVDGTWHDRDACGFSYRHSNIEGLIEDVEFLPPDSATTTGSCADFLARRKKFPPRTCGSVFKNPAPEMPAGRLLEAAGAKALQVGGARVWSEHANVIVADDDCTSSDILALARLMARAVLFSSGVRLEPEIRGLEV